MPWNGIPMNEPLNFSSIQRLPSTHWLTAVPLDSIAGWPGAIHDFTVTSHVPTMPSSFLCAAPGVEAFIHASIAAFCMSASDFFVSSANSALVHRASANPRVRIFRIVLLQLLRLVDSIAGREEEKRREEERDDREDQPARLDAELSAGEPRRAVVAAGEEARRDRLAAVVAAVRRAEDVEGDVVEQRVEADGEPDAAGADDGEGEEEAEQSDAGEVGGVLARLAGVHDDEDRRRHECGGPRRDCVAEEEEGRPAERHLLRQPQREHH